MGGMNGGGNGEGGRPGGTGARRQVRQRLTCPAAR